MPDKYRRVTRQNRHVELISSVIFITCYLIKFMVAGIIGAASAVFINARTNGGIVAWTACTDPTPDSVNPYLQAFRNYSFVSAHPYSGLSKLTPATCINFIQQNLSGQHTENSCFSPTIGLYTSPLTEIALRSYPKAITDYCNEFRKVTVIYFNTLSMAY